LPYCTLAKSRPTKEQLKILIYQLGLVGIGQNAVSRYCPFNRRMEHADMEKQQAVLGWMQILCHLGVTIPLEILFKMFTTGKNLSMKKRGDNQRP